MYRVVRYDPVTGMGFSLKPPAWLRNLVTNVTGGAKQAQGAVNAVAANYPSAPQTPMPNPNDPGSMFGATPSWVLPVGIAALGVLFFMRGRKG